MGKTIQIICPGCGEKLEVDIELKTAKSILAGKEIEPGEKLSRMIEKLRKEAATRDKRFQEAQESLQKRKKELEQAFEKLRKQAEKEIEEEGTPPGV